jgi:hypothetical protein
MEFDRGLDRHPESISTTATSPSRHRILDNEAATGALQGQLVARTPDERDT